MKLERKKSFALVPKPPFHFDGTFHKPSHFPDKMNDWEPGKYWQTMRVGAKLFGLKIEDKGTAQKPRFAVSIYSAAAPSQKEIDFIRAEINWRFELDKDPREFNALGRGDKRFYPIFKKWLGMRNSCSENLYELLIVSVVLQNATVRRTVQMMNALLEKYGTKLEFDGKIVYAIWRPEGLKDVSEQELRDLKIGYRAKFIKRISDDFAAKKVDEYQIREMDYESAKKELMKLYGVGPETARILLFEVFHHYNTFDHIAPWQQKIYSMLFYRKKLVPVKKIQKDIREAYKDYSALAVHYIWEDVFWRRKNEKIPWLEKEIRL